MAGSRTLGIVLCSFLPGPGQSIVNATYFLISLLSGDHMTRGACQWPAAIEAPSELFGLQITCKSIRGCIPSLIPDRRQVFILPGPIGSIDLQTFMDIVLHVMGHTDPLSS